jgi:predicted nucleic acid-binding protein
LDQLTGLDISDTFMGRAYRPSLFRHPKRLLSFLITELLTLGLILIFCLPLSLVIARNTGALSDDPRSTMHFLGITLTGAIALFALWNIYIWQQSKSLKTLAHLLDEVDKYNEILEAIHILDELGAVNQSSLELIDRDEILCALNATRESLVYALMTEKILRKHKRFIARRQDLFTQIEANLATLQALQMNSEANEYGQLLNDALQIAMSVRQEIARLNSK